MKIAYFKTAVLSLCLLLALSAAPIFAPPSHAQVFAPCDTRSGCTMLGPITYRGFGPPAVTGTGSPTITGTSTNHSGIVTAGASATSVVITFNQSAGTFSTGAPNCVVGSQTQLAAFAYTVTATAITITQTATSGNLINYNCDPN